MRVTFVISHADLSGGMRVIATYVEQLHRRGHDVTVVSRPKRKPTLKETINHRFRGRPLPWEARPLDQTHLTGTPAKHHVIESCRPIVASDLPDADVVVATWWETLEWVWPMPPSKGAKVHLMQDYEIFGGEKSRVDATCRLPMRRVVISHWLKTLMEREFGDTSVTLIPNGYDPALFHAPPRGRQPTPVVGTAYTRTFNKGTDIVLEAFRLAQRQISDLRLVAIANGVVDPSLPLPAASELFQQRPQHELRDIYARCDAWLFASRVEAFGLPVLEAMACRTPVLATPAGAAPELVAGGGGRLVPMENPAALAEAIVQLVRSDESSWRAMSDAAFATVGRYTWPASIGRFEAVLEEDVRHASGRSR